MKLLRLTLALLTTISIMSVSAYAQDATAPPAGAGANTFAALDSNSDGNITLEEFKANFVAGGNGGRTPQPDRLFGRWDADSDGMITAEEYENRPQRQPGQGRGQGQGE
jgi:Ca2+-binding EF-hand superfamily protein